MAARSKLPERIPVVNAYIRQQGRAPTLEELCILFHLRSKTTARVMATKLVKAGILSRTPTGRLAVRHVASPLRLLGSVAAGFPSPAEESLLDTMTLDEFLIRKPEATYMLKVEGDSMIEAGILPGDMVLVERGRQPKNGDVVIACVDTRTCRLNGRPARDVRSRIARCTPGSTTMTTQIAPTRRCATAATITSMSPRKR